MYALCIEDDIDGQGECRLLPGGGEDGGALHQRYSARGGGALKQKTNKHQGYTTEGGGDSILSTSF